MNIYEFVTPSDPITFKTDDDKVAYACAVVLGNGKAGCHRHDEKGNEVNLNTMLMLCADPEPVIKEDLGMSLDEFLDKNRLKMAECFLSFAYGSVSDRITYDDAMAAITDEEKRKEFKAKHEDRNRSSMSKWVKYAWQVGENLKKPKKTK
jgi:hypothetical protein